MEIIREFEEIIVGFSIDGIEMGNYQMEVEIVEDHYEYIYVSDYDHTIRIPVDANITVDDETGLHMIYFKKGNVDFYIAEI